MMGRGRGCSQLGLSRSRRRRLDCLDGVGLEGEEDEACQKPKGRVKRGTKRKGGSCKSARTNLETARDVASRPLEAVAWHPSVFFPVSCSKLRHLNQEKKNTDTVPQGPPSCELTRRTQQRSSAVCAVRENLTREVMTYEHDSPAPNTPRELHSLPSTSCARVVLLL